MPCSNNSIVTSNYDSSLSQFKSTGTICLGSFYNIQDGYNPLSLITCCTLSRQQFITLPLPSNFIRCIEKLAAQEKQSTTLVYLDRHKHLIPEDTTSPDGRHDDDNFVPKSFRDEDTDDVDNSPNNILIAGVMSVDSNTNQNITGVTGKELARAN